MKKKIKLPFTNEIIGGNKKSFKLLKDDQIGLGMVNKQNILNTIKKMLSLKNNNSSNENKVTYIKASESKEYYKKLNTKNKK